MFCISYVFDPALCHTNTDMPLDATALTKLQQRYTPQTRAILIDWVCEVCSDYALGRETYYLAVRFVNRYLFAYNIEKNDLQLVAAASISLAAKAEETHAPSIAQLTKSGCGSFSLNDIRQMEQQILSGLDWKVYIVT